MTKENRRTERFNANLFIEFDSPSDKSNLGRGVVIDVSLSGFAVDSEVDLPVNAEVDCHIEIPLKLRAKVIRSITGGQMKRYGLKFVGQGLIDKFILKKMLKGKRQTRKI